MNITTDPNPQQQLRGEPIDYPSVADYYNQLPVGERAILDKVYNITSFKGSLVRRGLTLGKDFKAYNKGAHCYIEKFTDTPMSALC